MPKPRKSSYDATPLEAVTHPKDRRPNISTAELADFAIAEEKAPYLLRYPSLDFTRVEGKEKHKRRVERAERGVSSKTGKTL